MSGLERWRGRPPALSPVELARQAHELRSLADRVDGWERNDRLQIGAVVVYGAMQTGAQVYAAAEMFEERCFAGGEVFRRMADAWAAGAESEVLGFFQRRTGQW